MSVDISNINITNLQPGEKVLLILRRHWIALVYVFSYFFAFIFVVLAVMYFGSNLPIIGHYVNIILVIFVSFSLIFLYINWMRYELDLYIITSKRIIGLEEISFLNRHLSECSLDKVQEVNAKTTGLLSNMLNFGEVTIHTASETSDFKMQFMSDAYDNARIISNLISENKTQTSSGI